MKNMLIAVSIFLLSSTLNAEEALISSVDFRVELYPFGGGYYAYPPYCPPGYYYGYGRGFGFYGPIYPYGPGCFYGPGYYRGPYHHYYYKKKSRH